MYIELKTSLWRGDKGVVMEIKASTYPQDPMSPQDALNIKAAVGVTISGLGEVSAHELGNPTWYGPRDLNSDEMGIVQQFYEVAQASSMQWLTSSGLLSDEETGRYTSTLSTVALVYMTLLSPALLPRIR